LELAHLPIFMANCSRRVEMIQIPYRGSAPALTDLMGGRVEVMFDTLLASLPHVRSGALRALGVTAGARSNLAPDIPAIAETVFGYEAVSWQGIVVRRGTSAEIVERLNKEINAGLSDSALRARFTDLAVLPRTLSPAEVGKFFSDETEKWAKVVKVTGAKPD
jgi:tripartite-type tricarboxylate transporter receptor subunit TctC